MNMTPERPWHAEGSVVPVILPIGAPRDSGWETQRGNPAGGRQGAMQVRKFTFPAIGDGAVDELFYAIWPRCDCTEAVCAGAKLANSLLGRLPTNRSSVVAVTSPCDGDGKTTLVEVLAPELARRTSGGVLAVDGDFRKSDLTARLAIPGWNTNGCSLAYPTDMVGLSVLPMSRQRLRSGADEGWIRGMRDRWPLTLLDMSSLSHRETAPVLRHCDGVCLAVRLGYTPRRAVVQAARIISICGGRFLGCVVVGDAA